jgi:TatD DNase family protein
MTGELWAKAPELTGDQIIADAVEAGVTRLLCVGCDLADSRLAAQFARSRPNCWASIGIHPHEASRHRSKIQKSPFAHLLEDSSLEEGREVKRRNHTENHMENRMENHTEKKIVAVGECGLDYFYEHSPRAAQADVLRFQIELALKRDLPLIFHVREAYGDFWPIFEQYRGIRGVLHSFTDSQENLERALGHGLFIGVNGIATFTKNSAQLEAYKHIPLQKLLLETDAPFLTPAPYRGKVDEPKYVRTTAEFLASLRGESVSQIAAATTDNACQLFGLS